METTNQQVIQPSTQENNQVEAVAEPKSKSLLTLLVIIVVILSIVSLVLAYLLLKPQTKSTQTTEVVQTISPTPPTAIEEETDANTDTEATVPSDWQSYKNKTYGFSFNYPNTLKLNDITATQDSMIQLHISITGDDSKILLSIEKRMCNSGKEWSSYKIDGIEALRNNVLDVMNGEYYAYDNVEVPMTTNRCLSIKKYTSTSDEKIKDALLSIDKTQFDQILSTFKFTDAEKQTISDGKQIGNIKNININSNPYLTVDYVNWQNCQAMECPNGYKVTNDDQTVTQLPIANSTTITMQTYGHIPDGNFNSGEVINLTQLANWQDLPNRLFWLTVKNGQVVKIEEQYQP